MHGKAKKLCKKISFLTLTLSLITPLSLMTPALTLAADDYPRAHGLYLGGGGGVSQDQDSGNDRKISGKAFAGLQFNKTFSVDAGYVDLGKHDTGNNNTARERGPFIALLAHFAVGEAFSPFIKGGVHRLELETRTNGVDAKQRNTDPIWGAGFNSSIGKHMGVRFEWERFKINNHDTDLVSANIVHYFR